MNSNELQIVCRKENYGEVVYNDGQFAEIQLIGIEGIEEGLLEETIQIQREETLDSADDFRNRLKAGTCLQVLTTTLVSGVDGFSFRH